MLFLPLVLKNTNRKTHLLLDFKSILSGPETILLLFYSLELFATFDMSPWCSRWFTIQSVENRYGTRILFRRGRWGRVIIVLRVPLADRLEKIHRYTYCSVVYCIACKTGLMAFFSFKTLHYYSIPVVYNAFRVRTKINHIKFAMKNMHLYALKYVHKMYGGRKRIQHAFTLIECKKYFYLFILFFFLYTKV